MTFSKKASVFVHSCSFRTFIHWKDMKIVLKQSDFSDPCNLSSEKPATETVPSVDESPGESQPAILVQKVIFQN